MLYFQAVYSVASGSHLYSGSQTIDYVANITHNASVLVCKVGLTKNNVYMFSTLSQPQLVSIGSI